VGPGEYFLHKGIMEVQDGEAAGGVTAVAPAYGYEPAKARHEKTHFVAEGAFYMAFLGPLNFIDASGQTIAKIERPRSESGAALSVSSAQTPSAVALP
jgi:hypothetical protein